jgi:hypothetical protein
VALGAGSGSIVDGMAVAASCLVVVCAISIATTGVTEVGVPVAGSMALLAAGT